MLFRKGPPPACMNSRSKVLVVALGGNAIKQAEESGTAEEQFRNIGATCRHILEMIREGYTVIITHGNGPQVGNLMLQQEEGGEVVPPQPLDILGAMTQGQIGYMIQQTLMNYLGEAGGKLSKTPVVTVVTQVLVDKNDPEFIGENATKPVGPFYSERQAVALRKERGYLVKKVKPTGDRPWRRVVPSPDPITIIEKDAIRHLVKAGAVVVASGGGGIPVISEDRQKLIGVEAVIDKDLAGERLAEAAEASVLLILTDVDKVALNYGKPNQRALDRMSLAESKRYLEEGHFLPGSMGPKVKACIRFLEAGGEKAIITSLNLAGQALRGEAGTLITG